MQAAPLHSPIALRLETVKHPASRRQDKALLRICRVGICGSREIGVLLGIVSAPEVALDVVALLQRECQVRGALRYANPSPTAIALCVGGRVNLKPRITQRFPLPTVAQAVPTARSSQAEAIKVMLEL